MPEARVQLAVEIETEGAEQLTSLRRELEQLGRTGQAALNRLDASLARTLDHLDDSRRLLGVATGDFLDSHRRLLSSLDPIFQGFFRRLLGGARGFSDALKRLLSDLLRYFLRTLEQMIAAWLTGFRRLGSPFLSTGAGTSNLFGGILGTALGLAPAFRMSGGIGTPPTFPPAGGGGGSATNLNLLAQFGIPVRDLTLGSFTIPGGLLASGGLLLGLAGVSRGSPVLGALGGAAAGFAFGGPIGAGIGALLGGLFGFLSRGKKKRQATRIAEAGFAEMRRVLEEFKNFQTTFEAALDAVHAIWEQMVAGFRQIGGKVGRRSITTQEPYFRAIVQQIEQIQRAREARAGLLAALPIPEFQAGGIVGQSLLSAIHSSQGKILAFLHRGEAVLNARAVASLGRGTIEKLNRAPSFQSGGFVSRAPSLAAPAAGSVSITLQVFPAPGMDERALANYTIRQLKRELRDQGRRL